MPATITTRVPSAQAFYSTMTGLILREDGKGRPATMDEIEFFYSRDALDAVMETPGAWVDLEPFITRVTRASEEELREKAIANYDSAEAQFVLVYNTCIGTDREYLIDAAQKDLDRAASVLAKYLKPITREIVKVSA